MQIQRMPCDKHFTLHESKVARLHNQHSASGSGLKRSRLSNQTTASDITRSGNDLNRLQNQAIYKT